MRMVTIEPLVLKILGFLPSDESSLPIYRHNLNFIVVLLFGNSKQAKLAKLCGR